MTQTQMTPDILCGNALIAHFMGATKGYNYKDGDFYYLPDKTPSYLLSELKYHSSWDWLMPVVDRIINMGWSFHLSNIGGNDAKFTKGEHFIQNVAWSTPLLATYNVVIDFITLHTQNQQQ